MLKREMLTPESPIKKSHGKVTMEFPVFRFSHPRTHEIVVVYLEVSIVMGVPNTGWFIRENPIKLDDLGVPIFQETSICSQNFPMTNLPRGVSIYDNHQDWQSSIAQKKRGLSTCKMRDDPSTKHLGHETRI